MEIDINHKTRLRLIQLLNEKSSIEKRINDILITITDIKNVKGEFEMSLNNEITKLIIKS